MIDLEKTKNKTYKQLLSNQKKDIKLIFKCAKKDRGTKLQIFSDGTIELEGPSCSYGFHIPSRLYNWKFLPQKEGEKHLLLWTNIAVKLTQNQLKWYKNILCKIYHNSNEGYILPISQDKNVEILKEELKTEKVLRVVIPGCIDGQQQLLSKNLFYSASQLAELTNLQRISNSKLIIYFHYRNQEVAIYQDQDGEIYIKTTANMDDCGVARLSTYFNRYIKDWFETDEFFLASKNNETPIVIPSVICKRQYRGGHLSKLLNFPYWGDAKKVEVILSRPEMQLTMQAKKNYQLRCLLQKAKCSVKGLMANTWQIEIHKDKVFANTIRTLISDVFPDNKNTIKVSEILLNFIPRFNSINNATSHCFDGLILSKKDENISVYLFEIISSFTSNKNTVIDTEIASFHHLIKKMGVNCIAILIINGELTNTSGRVVTGLYGINSGVLVMGTQVINDLIATPQTLIKTIKSFQNKRGQLIQNSNLLVHPITEEIVLKSQLENEALEILFSLANKKRLDRILIAEFCHLMGISVNDFSLLYKEGLNEKNIQMIRKRISTNNHNNEIPARLISNFENKNLFAFLHIHFKLVAEGSVSLLSTKSTLKAFLPYKKVFQEILPINVKIGRTKKHRNKGADFEQSIKHRLELEGFTVVSNVVFYYSGRTFEIDLVGIRGNELLLTSCKDMSSMTKDWQAKENIKNAANMLEFRTKNLNATNARLYVKTNRSHIDEIKPVYHLQYWDEHVKIIIID